MHRYLKCVALGGSMLLAASVGCGDSGAGTDGLSPTSTTETTTTSTTTTTTTTTSEPTSSTSASTTTTSEPTSSTSAPTTTAGVVTDSDSTTTDDPTTSTSATDSNTTPDTSTTAAMPACGDGNLDDGEQCDDGNQADGDGCESDCSVTVAQKIIFVTSQMYTGNFGGLAGADAKCQQLAEAADLPGTYLAWLSDANASPASRMTQADVPYVLPNGTKVADNWAGLTDGSLDAPINVTELGGPAPIGDTVCAGGGFTTVYTGTSASGTLSGVNDTCKSWTTELANAYWGHADAVNDNWSEWCTSGSCSWVSPIYCVQQ